MNKVFTPVHCMQTLFCIFDTWTKNSKGLSSTQSRFNYARLLGRRLVNSQDLTLKLSKRSNDSWRLIHTIFNQFGILESSESELLTGNQHRYFALQIVFILRQLNLNHQFLI